MMYPGAYMTGAMGWWMVFAFLASVALIAVLDERLARGEIDAQQYRERRGLIAG